MACCTKRKQGLKYFEESITSAIQQLQSDPEVLKNRSVSNDPISELIQNEIDLIDKDLQAETGNYFNKYRGHKNGYPISSQAADFREGGCSESLLNFIFDLRFPEENSLEEILKRLYKQYQEQQRRDEGSYLNVKALKHLQISNLLGGNADDTQGENLIYCKARQQQPENEIHILSQSSSSSASAELGETMEKLQKLDTSNFVDEIARKVTEKLMKSHLFSSKTFAVQDTNTVSSKNDEEKENFAPQASQKLPESHSFFPEKEKISQSFDLIWTADIGVSSGDRKTEQLEFWTKDILALSGQKKLENRAEIDDGNSAEFDKKPQRPEKHLGKPAKNSFPQDLQDQEKQLTDVEIQTEAEEEEEEEPKVVSVSTSPVNYYSPRRKPKVFEFSGRNSPVSGAEKGYLLSADKGGSDSGKNEKNTQTSFSDRPSIVHSCSEDSTSEKGSSEFCSEETSEGISPEIKLLSVNNSDTSKAEFSKKSADSPYPRKPSEEASVEGETSIWSLGEIRESWMDISFSDRSPGQLSPSTSVTLSKKLPAKISEIDSWTSESPGEINWFGM